MALERSRYHLVGHFVQLPARCPSCETGYLAFSVFAQANVTECPICLGKKMLYRIHTQ